jgi:hypothetical protein
MPVRKSLQIQLTFKSLLVFMFFFFMMHELHEWAHIITGRLICGYWGSRDFNVWRICTDCITTHPTAIIATFTGPSFTFIMLWLGWYLIKYSQSVQHRSLGLVLVLGNMQFGRMYMAAMGSGDEVWGLRTLFLNAAHSNFWLIKLVAFIVVSAICIPPLIAAYHAIGNKKRVLIFIGFLIIPLVLDTVIILILLNGILQHGMLNQVWIMGTPLLISLWLALCVLIVLTNYKSLTAFGKRTAS